MTNRTSGGSGDRKRFDEGPIRLRDSNGGHSNGGSSDDGEQLLEPAEFTRETAPPVIHRTRRVSQEQLEGEPHRPPPPARKATPSLVQYLNNRHAHLLNGALLVVAIASLIGGVLISQQRQASSLPQSQDQPTATAKWPSLTTPNADQPMAPVMPGTVVRVQAGMFLYGTDNGHGNEVHTQRLQLPAFEIHRYEVTVGMYRKCVQQRECSAPNTRDGAACNWRSADREDHPINCVSWRQAESYCASVGMRLPTEVEWEKAARGAHGQPHTWGEDAPSCEHAVLMSTGGKSCGPAGTMPVGSKPLGGSPYGAEDMIGNVWEWTSSDYVYRDPAASLRQKPAGQSGFQTLPKVMRGASWGNKSLDATVTHRYHSGADARSRYVGFRCVRSLDG